jgi:hypothetical protein
MLSTSSINGPMSPMEIGNEPSTPTWPNSTPVLLTRMGMTLEKPLNLLDQISPINKDTRTINTSLITCPEQRITKRKMNQCPEEREPEKKICLGTHQLTNQLEETYVSGPAKPSNNLAKTSQDLNPYCVSPLTSWIEYPHPNGITSLEENPSTSIKSSLSCTLSNLMMRERATWETLKLCLQSQNPNAKSKLEQSGQPPFADSQNFLFPHKEDEHREYAEHIEGLFATKHVGAHGKVILYN